MWWLEVLKQTMLKNVCFWLLKLIIGLECSTNPIAAWWLKICKQSIQYLHKVSNSNRRIQDVQCIMSEFTPYLRFLSMINIQCITGLKCIFHHLFSSSVSIFVWCWSVSGDVVKSIVSNDISSHFSQLTVRTRLWYTQISAHFANSSILVSLKQSMMPLREKEKHIYYINSLWCLIVMNI